MQRRRVRAVSARLDLDTGTFRVIRTVVEVNGHTAFKLYPKSGAGRRTVPLPDWLVTMLRTPCDTPLVAPGCYFSIQIEMPLWRTFRTRVWRPTLVRAGLLGTVTKIYPSTGSGDEYRAIWTSDDGNTAIEIFCTYAQAVKHAARHAGEALRFMICGTCMPPGWF